LEEEMARKFRIHVRMSRKGLNLEFSHDTHVQLHQRLLNMLSPCLRDIGLRCQSMDVTDGIVSVHWIVDGASLANDFLGRAKQVFVDHGWDVESAGWVTGTKE